MSAKWYRLDAYGSSRAHFGMKSAVKFTDLDKVTVFQVPRTWCQEEIDRLADAIKSQLGKESCIITMEDVKLLRLEEVPEEEVIAEELMKP